MDIAVQFEEEREYRRVGEIAWLAFSDLERIRRGQIG